MTLILFPESLQTIAKIDRFLFDPSKIGYTNRDNFLNFFVPNSTTYFSESIIHIRKLKLYVLYNLNVYSNENVLLALLHFVISDTE